MSYAYLRRRFDFAVSAFHIKDFLYERRTALGHPVGATGVRQVLDCHKQVTGEAGDYQVEGAKNAQTLNIGGSGTTSVSFVVGT